jgi:hypothetical protein
MYTSMKDTDTDGINEHVPYQTRLAYAVFFGRSIHIPSFTHVTFRINASHTTLWMVVDGRRRYIGKQSHVALLRGHCWLTDWTWNVGGCTAINGSKKKKEER